MFNFKSPENNIRKGPGKTVQLDDGSTIIEHQSELAAGYGRTNAEHIAFDGTDIDAQTKPFIKLWDVPAPALRRQITDPHNPSCPLSCFIGNMQAKKIIQRAAYAAWGRSNHACADLSFAMVGPASAGKTTLARRFGETIQLPFIEVPPKGLRHSKDLFDCIAVALEKSLVWSVEENRIVSLKMIKPDPTVESDTTMRIPPCVVFIDEVHGLPVNLREELLKAVESKDRMMTIENGWYADCRNVCWVVATTERGKLFGPFDSRFQKVELDMYSSEEMAQIVNLNNPDWNLDICRLVIKYCSRIPREALDFAVAMKQEHDLNGGSWTKVAEDVAKSLKIDCYGLTSKRLKVLVALGQMGSQSQGRLKDYAGCELEELVKFQMSALLIATPDNPALVTVTSKGYGITHAGLAELDKRGIKHRGDEVVEEGGQRLDFGDWNPHDMGYEASTPEPQSAWNEESITLIPAPQVKPLTFKDLKKQGPRSFADICKDMANL